MSKKIAYLFSVFFIIASGVIVPSISAQISTPQLSTIPLTVTLSVESADMSGTAFAGQWVELWQNGELLQEGFTPFLADVESGTEYQVFIYDDPDENKFFDHWEDSSTNPTRTITPLSDTTLTAFFQTDSASTSAVSLLVESADMSGESFEGMWVELWQDGAIIQEGPTPFSTLVESGVQYEIFANNFEDTIFDHWEDSSTNPQRAFTIDADATFTAFYQTDSTPDNNAPIANDDSAITDEDVPIDIDVMANDNFSGTGLFFVSSVTEPSNGMATINDDNTVTYLPNQDFFGSDSFEYTVSNPAGLVQDSAIVFVTVNPVNDTPVTVDDFITTDEDTAASFFAEANDFDVDGDEIFVASVEQGANGSAEISENGAVMYTPNPDFNGQDSFTYVLSDVNGATDTGMVSVMVNPINDAPIAADDSAQTSINQSVAIDVLANDSDADGDSLNVSSTSTPSNGTATINSDNTVTYLPDQNFTGNDSFTYSISDGNGGTDSATVSVIVPITTISVGSRPIDIAVDEAKNTIYVANQFGSSISVVDGSTDTVIDTIDVPPFPVSIALDASLNILYVSQQTNSSISVIDLDTKQIIDVIPVGGSLRRGLALDADDSKLYASGGPNVVHVINTTDNSVLKTVQVERPPFDLALNPVTDKVYVGVSDSFKTHEVVVIDGNSDSIITKILTEGSNAIDVDELNNIVYVASGTDILYTIDGSTNSIVKVLKTGGNSSTDVFAVPNSDKVLVTHSDSSMIILNVSTGTIEKKILVGSNPIEVVVNTSTNKIYVINYLDDTVTVLQGVE